MSRVRDRQHAERLTREAAHAIGKNVEGWGWDIEIGGLSRYRHMGETFAPLNNAAYSGYVRFGTFQLSLGLPRP